MNVITKILTAFLVSMMSIGIMAQEEDNQLCQIRITTDPVGATVSLDGETGSPSPLLLANIKPGEHLITSQKEGFKTHRQTVTLIEGQRIALDINLEPLTGLLLVHTEPQGAEVSINGADRGQTPLLITDLTMDKHRIQLSLPGYITKTIEVNILNRSPLKIAETLTPNSATLILDSDPSGADIILNGVSKGKTPATITRIPGGDSTLELTYEGCKPYKKTIKLSAGQEETLSAVLSPIPAKLAIVTIPDKARIYINNQFKGESPIILDNVAPGTYRIRADLKGCEPVARDIELKMAENRTEELRLVGNCGQVQITTEPAGITVFVGGKPRGVTSFKEDETDRVSQPLTIDMIPEGEQEVILTHKQYFPSKFMANIERDKTITIHKVMKRRFIPDYEVRTSSDIYKGVLIQIDPEGSVKLEIRPGIVKTIPGNEIKVKKPLQITMPDATE